MYKYGTPAVPACHILMLFHYHGACPGTSDLMGVRLVVDKVIHYSPCTVAVVGDCNLSAGYAGAFEYFCAAIVGIFIE